MTRQFLVLFWVYVFVPGKNNRYLRSGYSGHSLYERWSKVYVTEVGFCFRGVCRELRVGTARVCRDWEVKRTGIQYSTVSCLRRGVL